jgi:ATP-dependent Clp protease ATP-binding subunit ClpB
MEMKLEVSDAALALIAEAGFDPVFGARPLKRAIQERIENPLAKQMLEGRFGPKDHIRVDADKGQIVFGKA